MSDVLFLVLGLAIGAAVAWFWATGRARMLAAQEQAGLQSRAAAAESLTEELRGQVSRNEAEADAHFPGVRRPR